MLGFTAGIIQYKDIRCYYIVYYDELQYTIIQFNLGTVFVLGSMRRVAIDSFRVQCFCFEVP